MSVLEAVDVVRRYVGGDGSPLTVVDNVNLEVQQGEMVAIVGSSGAGKSTLLHLLGALDRPTAGHVTIAGRRIGPLTANGSGKQSMWTRPLFDKATARHPEASAKEMTDAEVSTLRNATVGFVFQFHHLLREFTALENVMMPMWIAEWDRARAEARARELLDRLGLGARLHHRPGELSGGEQQRTAVARALAVGPAVLLLDEPSGNLDHANSERLHDDLAALPRDLGVAMVVVTHNRALAARADRLLLMEAGHLHSSAVPDVVGGAVP
jgi:lipoprotein-releasing system ATP-binding protein